MEVFFEDGSMAYVFGHETIASWITAIVTLVFDFLRSMLGFS